MTASEAENKKVSFFENLFNRRVPQIFGIYIGVSWGLIEFTEWLIKRYMLSPNLVDLVLVILLSFIPSACIIAYYHGRPGRDRWGKTERLGIPLNVVAAAVIVAFLFQGKDLGPVSRTVTLEDETGQKVERVVPKSRFRKKIALFYFKNETGDASLDWLRYGISHMLQSDLSQDMFIESWTPGVSGMDFLNSDIYDKIENAGYKDCTGLPLSLEQDVAKEMHTGFFLSGKLSKAGENYVLENALYRTKNARLVSRWDIRGKDPFKLIDDLTIRLKEDLEIPKVHIEEVEDLPVVEIFTASLPAARLFTMGHVAMLFDKDWESACRYFTKAVREDPSFAQAYGMLATVYLFTHRMEKAAGTYRTLMKYIHKLPERSQLYMKSVFYLFVKKDRDRGLAVLGMIEKLYPEDVMGYLLKASQFIGANRLDDAIAAYRRVLELDPHRYEIFKKIGELYERKGDHEQALHHYRKFAGHFPQNLESFEVIGKLNRQTGDLEAAKEYYEKALLLEPENSSVLAVLANIEADMGNDDKALELFEEALITAKTAKERYRLYDELRAFSERGGRMKKVLEYSRMAFKALEEYAAPIRVLSYRIHKLLEHYVMGGEEKEAFRILADLESKYKSTYGPGIFIGYIRVYIKLGKWDEAEKRMRDLRDSLTPSVLEQLGFLIEPFRGKIYEMRGDYTQALTIYVKLLKTTSGDAVYLLRTGRCYRHLKQYEKAEEYIRKALKLHPYDPKSNYEIALLHLDMGNKEKAAEYLKITVEIWKDADPDYKPAQRAKKRLAEL